MTRPWTHRRIVGLAAVQVLFLGVVLAAARSTSAESEVGEQILWLNVAVVAAVASAVANGSLLVGARRSVSLRQRNVLDLVDARIPVAPQVASHDPATSPTDESLVSIPGLQFAHRPGCALVAGKRTMPAKGDQERCGWCSDE